jgi:hypothetical protein
VSDNLFLDESPAPDAAAIKTALGDKYPWYQGILEAASGFEQEWRHYGRKYGWKLKAHDGAKALFELTVCAGVFRIGMAVRETELQAMRETPELAASLAGLLDEKRSKEGWGIRMTIEDEGVYKQACTLIEAVAGIRRKG